MISICLATYNGENYIKEQIDSILSQIGDEDEVIVSDNKSTDSTIGILMSYKDKRIKIFHRSSHYKIPHEAVSDNFENALMNCKGDFVFLADQDDIWVENKVERMMSFLKDGYDLVTSDLSFMYNGIQDLNNRPWRGKSPKHNFLLRLPQYNGCTMAFNRKILNMSLPFPRHLTLHDEWIGVIGETFGKMYHIDEPLIYFRRHGDNTSGYNNNTLIYKVGYRLRFFFQIQYRLFKILFYRLF